MQQRNLHGRNRTSDMLSISNLSCLVRTVALAEFNAPRQPRLVQVHIRQSRRRRRRRRRPGPRPDPAKHNGRGRRPAAAEACAEVARRAAHVGQAGRGCWQRTQLRLAQSESHTRIVRWRTTLCGLGAVVQRLRSACTERIRRYLGCCRDRRRGR